MFAILVGVAGPAAASPPGDGIAMANRVTAAIKGAADFQDGDFVRPLGAGEKAALRRFAACGVAQTDYTLKADPTEEDAYVRNPDRVLVEFACDGVPRGTPVGISLHLQGGRIVTVETHNADLMRGN